MPELRIYTHGAEKVCDTTLDDESNHNVIECYNNTQQEVPHTGKQTCACSSDLSDASHVTCFLVVKKMNFKMMLCSIVTVNVVHWPFCTFKDCCYSLQCDKLYYEHLQPGKLFQL